MKVSVILPVYAVAQYIEKCTESLIVQTLDEMEFIYVDDHGPDNSIDLVRKMIAGHPREKQFRFLKPERNMGAGLARNFAIPEAKGEYIAFVDSDDRVEPTMFEELYLKAKSLDSDLCCCQMQKIYPDGHLGGILQNPHIDEGAITDESRSYFLTRYVSLFASFIYRRSFIMDNDIRFPEDRCADDSFFVSCVFMMAKSIAYVDKPFYLYLIRPGSVCTTKDSTKYQKRLTVFRKLLQFSKFRGVYDKFKQEIDFIYLKKAYLSSVFNYVINSTKPKKSTMDEIYNELLKNVPDYRNNVFYRKHLGLKVLVFLIRYCPHIAAKVIRIYTGKKEMVV